MQLKYSCNIMPALDGMQKVSGLAWSYNGQKLGVCTADRKILLFNDQLGKEDNFPTKPSDKTQQKSYVVRAIEFSPDSTKIAVAQSDNIVYVYKIGAKFKEKKTICNKFPASSSITTLIWPAQRENDIIFGLAEGKVKIGFLKNNKSQIAFTTESYVVSMATNRDGDVVVSGHLDGSVYSYNLDTQQSQKLVVHHSIPYALAYGQNVAAAGNDQKVSFYDNYGNLVQRFDYTQDERCKDFSVGACSPNGDIIVLGNFNRFYLYTYNQKRSQWEEIGVKHIENYYTITALCWKNDSSKLITGSLCGSVDAWDISMKKIRFKGKYDLNYIGPSQIVIQVLSTNQQAVIRSSQAEISKIDIKKERFVVAKTHETLIVGDLATGKTSEVSWRGSGNEKFDFTNENICMVFNAGELTLIEYGSDRILGTCRTEHMKNSLISAKVSYTGQNKTKVIAFLLDLQTLQIQDLTTKSIIATIAHDTKIDFLELNSHANRLIFRDKRRQLYLYSIKNAFKHTLLSFCNYAQWVPESEVIVAQNRNNLCVWYSIENPDKVTLYTIKGDVEEIERIPSTPTQAGSTSVIVSEGQNKVAYKLDQALIEFGFAIEGRDLEKAASILDKLELTSDTEANWKVLAQLSLEEQNLSVSEHCYAALGDVARAAYLRGINRLIQKYYEETGKKDGISYYRVQSKLAILDKQFTKAEELLLNHNEVNEAMGMYQDLHKWDEAIKIAEKRGHEQVKVLKENYYQWLIETGQESKAAELKENEGDFINAITLYLQGGLPAKAANIVFNCNMSFPQDLLERIASSLAQSGMYEKGGEFYEQMEDDQQALNCYIKGNVFKKAVELAKRKDPKLVKQLEESWANYLVENKETESAINHYVEAGKFQKAIEAAVYSRSWTKAIQLLQNQSAEVSRPYYRQVAKHYEDVRQYDFAEKYYIKANSPIEAFEMYVKASKWDKALSIAREYLPEEINQLYLNQGKKFEQAGKYKEAEKLYLTVQEYDTAILMYQNLSQYESVIRIASKYTPQKLKDIHLGIAKKLERENILKRAEQHYIEAGSWHLAMQMYKTHNQWEEAIRCCKMYGSEKETCQQAKLWAESLGPDAGLKMLQRLNLVDALIEYQSDRHEFEEAFKLANLHAKHKLQDVHFKYACHLEDERRYKEAEENFIKAGKASEAINMYEHLGDYTSALQVARQYEPQSVTQILISQAKFYIEKKDLQKAEQAYIQGKRPELAIKMYVDQGNYPLALKIAKSHAPHMVAELNNKYGNVANTYNMTGEDLYQSAQTWEEQRDYLKAIEIYLEVTPQNTQSEDVMTRAWERAIQIAANYDKDKYPRIVQIVCKRLIEIKKLETAAYLYEQVGQYQEAVTTYVQGREFEKAKQVAQMINNKELNAKLIDYITKEQRKYGASTGQANVMIETGDVVAAMEMLAQKNDWGQCLQLADKHGVEYLNKYLMRYVKITMQQGRFSETIQSLATYGMPIIQQNYPIYENLAIEIFVECDPKELKLLRQALYGFIQGLEAAHELKSDAGKKFQRFGIVSHLLNLRNQYAQDGIVKLHAQTCISLLRYCDLVRIDQLYLDAGRVAKKINQFGLAFVLLNRYLDIYEVIEDPDNNNGLGDGAEFQNSDLPSPYDVPMPEKNLISDKEKEEIRDWLLQLSVNQNQDPVLPTRQCDCGYQIYDASLRCFKCKQTWEPCIITGMPLLKNQSINCQSCGRGALKDAWNTYLQAYPTCPWCNKHAK
ncbi:unnamed protein product [Paramecium sonneborni]|uniref:IFT80/172/WDR35 TPR domain-containing protein n=1 Tax=Paramecium sonneborni TaxID=65129 RepID=A0A8S1NQY5_9CILI|nr:unnamed protein product [Paramecium sonneborni]